MLRSPCALDQFREHRQVRVNSSIQQFPVLPLRDIVVFPHMIVPLFVGREKSVKALEDVMQDDKQILLVAQKNAAHDDPETSDIYEVGTVLVDKEVQLASLSTAWESTKLHIDLTTKESRREDYEFSISGF